MLLFCTILRRNYPARLNGQGLKSQATFTIFLSSFFIFVFHFFSLFLFFSFLLFFSFSFFGDLSRARRGITILISPRDFYRFLSHSVPLNERPPFNPPSSGEYDRRLPLFTELPTFFVSIFFSLSLFRITTATRCMDMDIYIRSPSIYYSIHRQTFFGFWPKFSRCSSPKLTKKRNRSR